VVWIKKRLLDRKIKKIKLVKNIEEVFLMLSVEILAQSELFLIS
jgi:hypothetical protein